MSRRNVLLVLGLTAACAVAALPREIRAGAPASDADAARVELGRRLFFDPAVGRQGRIGCASCHDPEHGFSDARVNSVDEGGELPRHSQPLTDLGGEGFHWDGEFDTVREVVEARILPRPDVAVNAVRRTIARAHAMKAGGTPPDVDRLRKRASAAGVSAYYGDTLRPQLALGDLSKEALADARLARSGLYARGFTAAFGSAEPTVSRVVDAVNAYVNSLRTEENPFDRFLAGDDQALTLAARRGHALFVGKAGCVRCHVAEPRGGRALLTDGLFHDTGIGWDKEKAAFDDRGAGAPRMQPRLDGTFKTPSLRDVARRAPYMHDGRFQTLEQVVRYYDRGGTPHDLCADGRLDPRIVELGLTDAEVADLVAFLESLSGRERAGLGAPSPGRPKTLTVRVVDLAGRPRPGVSVELRPAGDRLRGASATAAARRVATDSAGEARFVWPLSTHVAVSCPGIELLPLGLVPDFVDSVELMTADFPSALYTLPRSLCEGVETLLARGTASGELEVAVELVRVRELPHRRTLYAVRGDGVALQGRYVLSNASTGEVIGAWDLGLWRWGAEPEDFVPALPLAPQDGRITDADRNDLDELLGTVR